MMAGWGVSHPLDKRDERRMCSKATVFNDDEMSSTAASSDVPDLLEANKANDGSSEFHLDGLEAEEKRATQTPRTCPAAPLLGPRRSTKDRKVPPLVLPALWLSEVEECSAFLEPSLCGSDLSPGWRSPFEYGQTTTGTVFPTGPSAVLLAAAAAATEASAAVAKVATSAGTAAQVKVEADKLEENEEEADEEACVFKFGEDFDESSEDKESGDTGDADEEGEQIYRRLSWDLCLSPRNAEPMPRARGVPALHRGWRTPDPSPTAPSFCLEG
jgi:hypothetical protein